MKNPLQRCGVAGVLLVLLGSCGKMEKRTVEVGFQGLAAQNPFLAAGFLAEELGYSVQHSQKIGNLPPTDWVLLVDSTSLSNPYELRILLDWAAEGGHLWISGIREPEWNPRSNFESTRGDVAAGASNEQERNSLLDGILEELQAELEFASVEAEPFPQELDLDPPLLVVWPSFGRLAQTTDWADESLGDPSESALLRFSYGDGIVDVFAGLQGFDNRNLREEARAQLFQYLLEYPSGAAGLQILHGGRSGFFALLWKMAAPALLLAGLWLVLWVYRGVRRFGPVQEDPAWDPEGDGIGRGREFVEHLEAAGMHYRRAQQGDLLWRAACLLQKKTKQASQPPGRSHWWQRMRTLQESLQASKAKSPIPQEHPTGNQADHE